MSDNGTTWIVVCAGPSGVPVCEYVEGEQLVHDNSTGALEVVAGSSVVRQFPAGTWSNYAEWISTDTWAGGLRTQNPLLAMSSALPSPRSGAVPAGHPFAARGSSSVMSGAVRSPFSGR
jgi:hypothetical protein